MNDFARDALSRFVRGELSVPDLQASLEGSAAIDFQNPAERVIKITPGSDLPTVGFSRGDVANAIRRFLNFEVESEDLSSWAAVVRMLDSHFNLDSQDPDPDAVWDVIDRLMSSDVLGALDRQTAEALLETLER